MATNQPQSSQSASSVSSGSNNSEAPQATPAPAVGPPGGGGGNGGGPPSGAQAQARSSSQARSTKFMTPEERKEWANKMNEMKRAKKGTMQPAVPLQPTSTKEPIRPEVKQVVQQQQQQEGKKAEEGGEDTQAKYKKLVDHYTKEFNERVVPTRNEKSRLQSLAKKELEQLAKDPYLTRILGGYVEASVNGRFDELEKKLGLLAELSDEDYDELGIHSSDEDTSPTKVKKRGKSPTPPTQSDEDEYSSSSKEKKGKAPEKPATTKKRRGSGPFGDDSDDEIDYSKSKTETNRQARYQTRPYYRPKPPIHNEHLDSLF